MTPCLLHACRSSVPSVLPQSALHGRRLNSCAKLGGLTRPMHGEAYLTIASRRQGGRMIIAAALVLPLTPLTPLP